MISARWSRPMSVLCGAAALVWLGATAQSPVTGTGPLAVGTVAQVRPTAWYPADTPCYPGDKRPQCAGLKPYPGTGPAPGEPGHIQCTDCPNSPPLRRSTP